MTHTPTLRPLKVQSVAIPQPRLPRYRPRELSDPAIAARWSKTQLRPGSELGSEEGRALNASSGLPSDRGVNP